MDNPREPHVTPTTTDDESITTSTASDVLDSWTLVTDKKNPKIVHIPKYEEESNVEDLPKYEDLDLETSQSTAKEEQETEPSPEHHADTTSVTDEFSDEVSIISESESGDVLAPRPFLREHLQTLKLKFTTGQGLDLASLLQQQQQEEHRLQQRHVQEQTTPPNTPIQLTQGSKINGSYQTRQRKRRSPSIDTTQRALRTHEIPPIPCTRRPPQTIRRAYTWFFYSIVALTLLGFYGKMGLIEWPSFGSDTNTIDSLEKKFNDMELQNNLMRAEIDLLSKQVNYLKNINLPKNGDRKDKQYQQNNEFGDFPEKLEKPKERKTYKPQESKDEVNYNRYIHTRMFQHLMDEEEIATESPDITETTPDTAETNVPVVEDPDSAQTQNDNGDETPAPSSKFYDGDDSRILRERYNKHNGKERRDFGAKNEEKLRNRDERPDNFKRQHKKRNSKERVDDDDDDSDERKNYKKDSKERYNEKDNSKERKYKRADKEHNESNEDNSEERKYKRENNDNSKERKYKRENNDNSKERKYKREDYEHKRNNNVDYKEEYYKKDQDNRRTENFKDNPQQQRRSHSGERSGDHKNSGEWHEKLMKQREKARNEQEQRLKREKNWYLNRNEGREQWRSEEMNRR